MGGHLSIWLIWTVSAGSWYIYAYMYVHICIWCLRNVRFGPELSSVGTVYTVVVFFLNIDWCTMISPGCSWQYCKPSSAQKQAIAVNMSFLTALTGLLGRTNFHLIISVLTDHLCWPATVALWSRRSLALQDSETRAERTPRPHQIKDIKIWQFLSV